MSGEATPPGALAGDEPRACAAAPGRGHWWLLFGMVSASLVMKVWLNTQVADFNADGNFYTEVAQHVRDGRGLVTNVSMYHQGYSFFPHPTSIYPLWPLLYGYLSRVLPLEVVAIWVPTLLFFLSLLFAFLWASAVFPAPLLARRFPSLTAGHVLVLLLALNPQYFKFTSLPYTEGLATALLFAALWRSTTLFARPSLRAGLELGLWLGLLFLARSQLIIVAIAAGLTLGWAISAVGARGRTAWMAVGCGGAFATVILPELLYVEAHFTGASFHNYLWFEQARDDTGLSPFVLSVPTEGPLDYLADRAAGLREAFNPFGRHSYQRTFNSFCLAVPVGAVLLAIAARKLSRPALARCLAWARAPQSLPWIFVALLAAGGFFAIHTIHLAIFEEWHFGRRHAVTAVLLIFFALLFLLRHEQRVVRRLAVALLVLGTIEGVVKVQMSSWKTTRAHRAGETLTSRQVELVQWVQSERASKGRLTLAVTNETARELAWQTSGVGYHWVYEKTTLADLDHLLGELGVDYLVVTSERRAYAFMGDRAGFELLVQELPRLPGGARVFVPRRPLARAGSAPVGD